MIWDMGHKLQLVYGYVFLTSKDIKDLNKVVFGLMGEFVSGQDSLRFKEIAMELGHPTLANKKSQETRWARAELSAYYAFFRNIPTMYALYGRDDLEASATCNATAQTVSQKKLKWHGNWCCTTPGYVLSSKSRYVLHTGVWLCHLIVLVSLHPIP